MDVLGRDSAPFSGRVWQQIDAAVAGVKQANCVARRFLEVDGPYGLGLTSLSRDDILLPPRHAGATPQAWGVRRAILDPWAAPDADPDESISGRGTFLVQGSSSPVPLITSEFLVSIRGVEAFDDECQPLDLSRAIRAARDVALEEERLIFYGNLDGSPFGLLALNFFQQVLQYVLQVVPALVPPVTTRFGAPFVQQILQPTPQPISQANFLAVLAFIAGQIGLVALLNILGRAPISLSPFVNVFGGQGNPAQFLQGLVSALQRLADRGFPGPYALVVSPLAYGGLLQLLVGTNALLLGVVQQLFGAGVHVAPVIQPDPRLPPPIANSATGVIVSANRAFVRLVVGQDWTAAYRGTRGMYHRFVLVSSLRLEITEPRALQVLL